MWFFAQNASEDVREKKNGENVKRDESGEKMKLKPIITNFNRISFSYAFKRKVLSDFHKFKLWT